MAIDLNKYKLTTPQSGSILAALGTKNQQPIDLNKYKLSAKSNVKNLSDQYSAPISVNPFGVAKDVVAGTVKAFSDIPQGFSSAVQRGSETMQKGGIFNFLKGAGQAGLGAAGSVAGAVVSPLTSFVGSMLKRSGAQDVLDKYVIKPAADVLSNSPAFQKFATTHPNAERDITDATNLIFASTLKISNTPVDVMELKNLPEELKSQAESVKTRIQTRYSNLAADEWNKITDLYAKNSNRGTGKYVAEAKANGYNINEGLAKRGIDARGLRNAANPKIMDTTETATRFRDQEPAIAEQVITNTLKVVDQQRAPDDLAIIKTRALNYVNDLKEGSAERATMKDFVNSKFSKMDYPDGKINLEQQNLEKRAAWKVYDKSGTPEGNLRNAAEKQIGRAFKDNIESGVKATTNEVNIKALNRYVGDMYTTADYLDSLNGRRVPVSMLAGTVERVARLGGIIVGEKVIHGVLGGLTGYYAARSLTDMLEELPNPVRAYVLRDLQVNQPQAVMDAANWLKGQTEAIATRPALSPPGAKGTLKNPLITPPPKSEYQFGRETNPKLTNNSQSTEPAADFLSAMRNKNQ